MANMLLASASPRRKQLLEQLGWVVDVHPVNMDESIQAGESAAAYCQRVAMEKAEQALISINTALPVLTADTTVVLLDEILGKPKDQKDAFEMLKKLSGHSHQVLTAVTLSYNNRMVSALNTNTVEFCDIPEIEIENYIATGEPLDKAGSYGIQGQAAKWIASISGSYSGIMGLPLYETTQLCKKLDIMMPSGVQMASQK